MSLGRHIHEIAYSLADARLILASLDGTGVVVLGGDFWRRAATEEFRPTYENWYVERAADESGEQFAERSLVRATKEVMLRQSTGFLVTLTCEVVLGFRKTLSAS
jgi:Immunity protein 40